MTIRLVLPLPPSVNHAYTRARTGSVFLTPEAKAFKQQVWYLCGGKEVPPNVPLKLTARVWFDSKRQDLDNRIKFLQDAMADGLGFNDNRIVELHLFKHVDRGNARVEVELSW